MKQEHSKYYATEEIRKWLFAYTQRILDIYGIQFTKILESSAGKGDLLEDIEKFNKPFECIDKYPDKNSDPRIRQMDFFHWRANPNEIYMAYSGPPYHFDKEIKKALYYTFLDWCAINKIKIIAFISPASAYKKQYFKKDYKLVCSENLGNIDFNTPDGKKYKVKSCINIWIYEEGYIAPINDYTKILENLEIVYKKRYSPEFKYNLRIRGYAGELINNYEENEYCLCINVKNPIIADKFDIFIKSFRKNFYNYIYDRSTSQINLSKTMFLEILKEHFSL